MKKALTVSLAQTLFTIEDDAYAILDHYLQSVKGHFANTPGQEEIIQDIEGRIAEQFLESGKSIITLVEVNNVIASMGAADQFGDTNNAPKVESVTSAKKKLYRNPDDKVVAGVCSGIAAYLDVDVVWVRLAAVILVFANGLGVLAYIILWLVMPEAKTASQKLEMTGSPVNLATLSENVKERVSEAAEKAGPTFRKIVAAPFVVIGIIFRAITQKIFPLIRVLFGLVITIGSFFGIIAVSFFAAMILTGSPAKYADFPVMEVVSAPLFYGVIIGGYFALLIPALFIFMSGISVIKKKNIIKPGLGFGLLGAWCVALVTAGACGVNAGTSVYEYRASSPEYQVVERTMEIKEEIEMLEIANGQRVTLIQGEKPGVVVKGREKDLEYVDIKVEEGTFGVAAIKRPDLCLFCDDAHAEVILTVPDLKKITVSEGSRVSAEEWKSEENMEFILENGSRIEMNLTVPELNVSLKNGSRLDLIGQASSSTFKVEFGSRVEAVEFAVENIVINAKFGARLAVNAIKTLSVTAEQGARVDYSGEPVVTKKVKEGARVESIF